MSGLRLLRGQWYGWQMLPGYGEGHLPYFSPIQVAGVASSKIRHRTISVAFWNIMYAEGAHLFETDLRILKHADSYLIAEIVDDSVGARAAVISALSFQWLSRFCPELRVPTSDEWSDDEVSQFLERTFGGVSDSRVVAVNAENG